MPYIKMKPPKKQKSWKDSELMIIRDNYKIKSDKELVSLLKGRTEDAIAHKRAAIGFSR